MFNWGNRKKPKGDAKGKSSEKEKKIINASIDEVRQAVNAYASSMKKGISLRSVIQEDHKIDYDMIYSYLGGIPDKQFYMSRETFEIFEDPQYPKYIDLCQIACDQYYLEKNEEPVTPGDPYRKLNYLKLKDYLKEKPPFQLYLHPRDKMVTHRSPKE
ncbi:MULTISPECIES: DUF3939 domain-containing protein [Bacillaceae]|uniref:DUF3939 domain-containing protein n=1 Tax=Evansella alkalicola TaxID=745819 RepID=A0ABS6JQR4_9BACI|nr:MULTISPECIES: DUF3939 domain-containing protein [Bacillaceae]MBU9720875.1 DUF3939 domain-containing protein [Bacillus alkalicola]